MIVKIEPVIPRSASIILVGVLLALSTLAATYPEQKNSYAVLTPDNRPISLEFARHLSPSIEKHGMLLDGDLAAAALRSFDLKTPYNLDLETARSLGEAIGCNYYLLVRTAVQRRSSAERESYWESHAALFLVNSSTGMLDGWIYLQLEEETEDLAVKSLLGAAGSAFALLLEDSASRRQQTFGESESSIPTSARPAMPYRRISPEYTALANLQNVTATVDIEVSIDDKGSITRTRIVRWAGYGLDESVEQTVRSMKWRPAELDGRFLASRVLLRYNFREIEEES